jgi:hypothetical protein
MHVLPDVENKPWVLVDANRQGEQLPWPVFVGNVDYLWGENEEYRYLGRVIWEHAQEHFEPEQLEESLWCGFSGWRVVLSGTHGNRDQAYAVETEGLISATIPNPLHFAFRNSIPNLPTVAMYDRNMLQRHDPDSQGGPSKLYVLKPRLRGLDVATRALFTFRSDAYDQMMERPSES